MSLSRNASPPPSLAGGLRLAALIALGGLSQGAAHAGVVINEIMYHPPDDRDELQWVELLNTGTAAADLSGWSFSEGIKFTFPQGTRLAPDGLLVVSRDLGGFRLRYGREIPVVGEFTGQLSHGGEKLTLADRDGKPVDSVEYDDRAPWPTSPDGGSVSLERIRPDISGMLPENWAPSPTPETQQAAGTPGAPNASLQKGLPPVVEEVRFETAKPGQPVPVTAKIRDPDGIKSVTLHYSLHRPEGTARNARPAAPMPATAPVTLSLQSGASTNGTWTASIPAAPQDTLVRFHLEAVDGSGSVRRSPHPDDSRPTYSFWSGSGDKPEGIPVARMMQFGATERRGPSLRNFGGNLRRGPGGQWISQEPSRGQSAVLITPPGGGAPRLFDHIRITPRQGGWKVRLNRDQPFDGLATINVFDEGNPRYLLSEYLSYELYRASGVPAPTVNHWRVLFNGRMAGLHLAVEQPNSSFLKRAGRNADSELFKLLWYGRNLVEQHEKKNRPETGHVHLMSAVDQLRTLQGAPQWDYIQRHFHVDEFASYYAVNMCIQNWDGFFNNYFVYREPGKDGRWGIIPWDEDKTWGDYDGASSSFDWYTMPLDMGMDTDRSRRARSDNNPFGFDTSSWWRPPGVFSGPLLANPEFRKRFRTRLREICNTVFTVEKMEETFTRLERNLAPDLRSGLSLDSFRRQVKNRREFVLKELAREER